MKKYLKNPWINNLIAFIIIVGIIMLSVGVEKVITYIGG